MSNDSQLHVCQFPKCGFEPLQVPTHEINDYYHITYYCVLKFTWATTADGPPTTTLCEETTGAAAITGAAAAIFKAAALTTGATGTAVLTAAATGTAAAATAIN